MEKDLYLKIGRPQNVCVLCGTPIALAGKHASVLLRPEEIGTPAAPEPSAPETPPTPKVEAPAPVPPVKKGRASASQEPDPDGPMRQDYCPACWEKVRQKNYFSFWIARREAPKPRKIKNRKERNAALLAYFDVLVQKNDSAYAQHLFFLAHLLMKFSVLKWVRSDPPTEAGGRERIVFRNTATDDHVTIDSVALEDEAVARIKREIDEYICRNVEAEP